MNNNRFDEILKKQLDTCSAVLSTKAEEYATDKDRLSNFKVAAAVTGTTLRQALAGMMAKHTVSVYDMCKDPGSFPTELWDEKITDHINYLILLRAIVAEELVAEISNKIKLPTDGLQA